MRKINTTHAVVDWIKFLREQDTYVRQIEKVKDGLWHIKLQGDSTREIRQNKPPAILSCELVCSLCMRSENEHETFTENVTNDKLGNKELVTQINNRDTFSIFICSICNTTLIPFKVFNFGTYLQLVSLVWTPIVAWPYTFRWKCLVSAYNKHRASPWDANKRLSRYQV